MCRAGKRAPPAPPARPDPRRSPPPVNFPGMPFDLAAPYPPAGDQPRAIRELGQGLVRADRYQVLLGVTGSGKTFTMAPVGEERGRDALLEELVRVQYQRNDVAFERGTFRVRGDTVEVFPAYDEQAVRVEFWGDAVDRITKIDPLTGDAITELRRCAVYPATHFVTERPSVERAVQSIRAELKERLTELVAQNKLLEAQRLESRTHFDIDMLLEVGRCTGIENYSRHLAGRRPGERPACLLDYFPDDYLCIIDESHQTLPQLAGMYEGDRSRKQTLVDYGFRLPSALDNRPLRIDEFMKLVPRILFVSATPGEEEFKLSGGVVVEQSIRPR